MIAIGEDVHELMREQQGQPHRVYRSDEHRIAGLLDQRVCIERPEPIARADPRGAFDEPLVVDGQ